MPGLSASRGKRPMTPFRAIALLSAATFGFALFPAAAQTQTPPSPPPSQLTEKLNAYVGCINRLSERSYQSRSRYFSWAKQSGPTGKERIIYGTYTIYDTSDCKKSVEKANALEPRDAALEAAASAYADAVAQTRAAAERGRRLLRAGELQGRQDGQGQGAASAPRRGVGRIRERRQGAAQRRRSHQGQARRKSSPRSRRRKAARCAITSRR